MTTPNRQQIIERAKQLWHSDRAKRGDPSYDIEPELSELREEGFISAAQSELMMDENKAAIEEYFADEDQLSAEPFAIDLDEAMKTGIAVTGTSASGKTNLGFVIADLLMKHGVIVFVVDPSQAWMRNSNVPNVVTVRWNSSVTWKEQSTILDVSRLTVLQQKEFVEKFCKTMFNARVDSNYRPQTFIFFEEAHLFFPEGSMRSKKYQEALRIVTVGRNYNIRFGLITQWCALIDKTVLKFPRQKWFGYTDEKNDKKYLRNFIGKRVDKLESLKVGEFVHDYGKTTKKVQVPLFKSDSTPKPLPMYFAKKPKTRKEPSSLDSFATLTQIASLLLFVALIVSLAWR